MNHGSDSSLWEQLPAKDYDKAWDKDVSANFAAEMNALAPMPDLAMDQEIPLLDLLYILKD